MRIDSNFIPLPIEQPDQGGDRRVGNARSLPTGTAVTVDDGTESFADVLCEAITEVNETQREADAAVRRVATGQADSPHEAMIALEKADLTLRLTTQVTQRAIEAYNHISRMQI